MIFFDCGRETKCVTRRRVKGSDSKSIEIELAQQYINKIVGSQDIATPN